MKTLDVEMVLICAVTAVFEALGLVAGAAAFVGIRFQECDAAALTAICFGLGGLFWVVLLIFNSSKRSKRG